MLQIKDIKLIYSEKATKIWRNLPLGFEFTYFSNVKREIFVTFSKNLSFTTKLSMYRKAHKYTH